MDVPTRRLDNTHEPHEEHTRRFDQEDSGEAERPCLRCGQELILTRLIQPLTVTITAAEVSGMRLALSGPLMNLFLGEPPMISLQILVCTRCGYVEWYAPAADTLLPARVEGE